MEKSWIPTQNRQRAAPKPPPLTEGDARYSRRHPDGKHLFSAGRDQHVKIWHLEDGKHVRDLGEPKKRGDWISGISISPDGRLLAAADAAGKILVYLLTG